MRFSEFVGNSRSVNRMKEAVTGSRAFHAYIIDGAEGSGKRRLAYTFVQALMCENRDGGEPCGVCAGCRKVAGGNHSDVHYITPSGNSIKDEQIERLQEYLRMKPFDSEYTAAIIDKADTMTERAQNRLLKTMEEPYPGVKVLLLTENRSDILPTIISRSQTVRLKPVETGAVRDFLIEKHSAEPSEAETAAAYSYGSPGKAVKLLKDEAFKNRREGSIKSAIALKEASTIAEFMGTFGDIVSGRHESLEYLDMMMFWYRDVMLIKTGAGEKGIMNTDRRQQLESFGRGISLKSVTDIIEKLEEAKHDIMMNVNINYVLKNMYLEIN